MKSPVVSVDLYATLCELAGAKRPDGQEGVSMMPALTGGEALRKAAFAELKPRRAGNIGWWQMARMGRWKYVKIDDTEERLYDLEADPNELKPAEDAKALEEMRALHRKWLEATPK